MSLLKSNEVGLRLLLSPLGSNVVFRTACCSVGVILPVYSTFKAIESKKMYEQQRWLVYWAVYGSFTVVEAFTDKLISWFPLYYHMKFAFLIWLQLPTVHGAKQLYVNYLRPFLLAHQDRLDQIVGCLYTEMLEVLIRHYYELNVKPDNAKFLSAHQEQMQFAKRMITKLISSAKQALGYINHPGSRRSHRAIEGPESEPENDE